MFQFLIGWLQTTTPAAPFTTSVGVSIPYRLATNVSLFHLPFIHFCFVSIPYRLATNKYSAIHFQICGCVSIPYRLATNFLDVLQLLSEFLVSIPYRLATNYKIES